VARLELVRLLGRKWNRLIGGLLLAAALLGAPTAMAADKIRVGKSVSQPFAFAPLEIGTQEGIWAKHGLEVEVVIFAGDAKLQQGLVANSVDFGLGSGPAMGFLAKGVPAKAVGALANQPLSMGLIVGASSTIRKPEELKGAKIGVTTNGSLTYWLARELSRQMGWGSERIETVALGAIAAQFAALKRGQVDGIIMSSSQGYKLEKNNEGRLLLKFGTYIKDFHTHVIYATNDMIKNKPDQVRRFLAGWKDVIAFMAANKDETVRIARQVTGLDEAIESREYDDVMPMMSRDLRFSPKALDVIANSLPEMGITSAKPDMRTLYTEEFLDNSK
jgi:ABC-type nitrate/sulfonate/bicarbonate transport system substrate-binding protein